MELHYIRFLESREVWAVLGREARVDSFICFPLGELDTPVLLGRAVLQIRQVEYLVLLSVESPELLRVALAMSDRSRKPTTWRGLATMNEQKRYWSLLKSRMTKRTLRLRARY